MPARTLTKAEWLERLEEHAITRGGDLLSDSYLGTREKHWWQCREGHAFTAAPSNVLHHGSWCPFCAGNARLTIDVFEAIARAHDGELLPYDGKIDRYSAPRFRCKRGHEFKITFQNYQQRTNSWCVACEREETYVRNVARLMKAAVASSYQLLEPPEKFHGGKGKFLCSAGHEYWCRDWEFRVRGDRCGVCFRLAQSKKAA